MLLKKIQLLFFLSLIFFKTAFSQNLVYNPSFEIMDSCPVQYGDIDKADGWFHTAGSPDYFNSCSLSCSLPSICIGVPNNASGYQWPFEGNGYAGLFTYIMSGPSGREQLGTQLISELTIGVKYFVSAYICRANEYYSQGATNNLGFRFSTVKYSDNSPSPIDNFSHIHCDSILTDSVNWFRLSGSFIADSAYKYLIIGNFYDDQHTDTLDMFGQLNSHAYYYIDNVCVSEDSTWQATTNLKNISNQNIQFIQIHSQIF